jgi:hypothetical protein
MKKKLRLENVEVQGSNPALCTHNAESKYDMYLHIFVISKGCTAYTTTTVAATHKDDAWASWLDNRSHMCEHSLQRIAVKEATERIASLAPWSSQYQSVQPYGHHDNAPTLEVVVIHQGRKGDSCKKVSYLVA